MNKAKVIKPWKSYRVGSVYKFTQAEIKALKALGYVEDYVEQDLKREAEEAPKETKKRTYKRKDMQAD